MFLVLGAVTVVGPDGQVVALSDRQRSLLASLLARAGAVVSVDSLVDLVWPEDPPQDPVAALHNQVSRLRRALPFAAIETVAPGYRLAVGPDDVDSRRFDRLVRADTAGSLSEALSLWHGAAYAEFAESPVARFEAIRLEEARRQATERWHELRLDQGSADLAALEAFATEYPLRERAHLTRMRALYASGRQADALAAYQRYAGRLADELGLEPSAAMQELQLRILRHSVAPPTPLRTMQVSHVSVGDRRIAVATVGSGQPLIALPGWVSNLDVIAAGRDLLAGFGVQVGDGELSLLHQRSEGWAAAVQMAALSLRGAADPARIARALEVRGPAIAEFFVSEVLEQQPPEVAQFMLDTSILGELTADTCAAVTGRPDAGALLRAIGTAQLFLVPLDDEQASFRYHHLVRQLLRAELRARDPAREQEFQLRSADWFEAAGDTRRAARHFLAARQADRAVALLEDRVVPDFLADPAMPPPLDVTMIDASVLAGAPDRLLTVAADLLLSGDTGRGGQYLDLLERVQPPIPRESRLGARFLAFQSVRHALIGQADQAVSAALAVRSINEQMQLTDEWNVAAPMILPTAYTWLEDFPAVEREAAVALATPELTEPVKRVMVPGVRALAWFEAGLLKRAADTARAADAEARRLGFDRHFFAMDYLRTLAGLALEQRDLDTAEQLTEQALSIAERRRPMFEFLALLDRARIWAARGQVREALATIEAARQVLAGTGSVLLTWADELEALLRLSLGDPRTPAELASRLPPARRSLLLARIALASGDHRTAAGHLHMPSPDDLTPRRALLRELLLAAAAIERGDPTTPGVLGGAIHTARQEGYLNTVVTTASQVTSYLIEHALLGQRDPFLEQLIGAGLEARAVQPDASRARSLLAEPLTPAELRVLKLLPTSTYLQMAEILYVSRNTVKTHLRSVYQKLGVESRSQAIERAVELHLL